MNLVTRSLGAAVLFSGVLLLAWLTPGPLDNVEVGGNAAYAGGTKRTTKKKTTNTKASSTAKKQHVHIKKDIKLLKAARKNLASTPVQYGGHREKALNHISTAIHELNTLEKHLKKLAAGKKK